MTRTAEVVFNGILLGSCLHNSWTHQSKLWQKILLEIFSSSLGHLIDPFGWRWVVGSLLSHQWSPRKRSKPQSCWQNWGWMLCSPLGALVSLCKQECGTQNFRNRVNWELCVCVHLMRAFPSTNTGFGCFQCLFVCFSRTLNMYIPFY